MKRKAVMFLFLLAILFLASQKVFACAVKYEAHVLKAAPSHNHEHEDERSQCIRELEGHGRNSSALFSKPDGTRIIENIRSQRTRSITQSELESEKARINYTCNKAPVQSDSTFEAYQSNNTELRQNIKQRK